MMHNEIYQIAHQLNAEGKKPSVALIRAKLSKPISLPVIVQALQQWKMSPQLGESSATQSSAAQSSAAQRNEAEVTIEASQQHLQQKVIQLEQRVCQLEQQLSQLLGQSKN